MTRQLGLPMSPFLNHWIDRIRQAWFALSRRGAIEGQALVMCLAVVCGLLAGYGAVLFTTIIHYITDYTYGHANDLSIGQPWWNVVILICPAIGLWFVAYLPALLPPKRKATACPR